MAGLLAPALFPAPSSSPAAWWDPQQNLPGWSAAPSSNALASLWNRPGPRAESIPRRAQNPVSRDTRTPDHATLSHDLVVLLGSPEIPAVPFPHIRASADVCPPLWPWRRVRQVALR